MTAPGPTSDRAVGPGLFGGATLKSLAQTTRLYFAQALSVELTYRFGLISTALGLAVGLIGLVIFWRAAGAKLGVDSAYSAGVLTAYFTMAFAQLLLQAGNVSWVIANAIRLGKLSTALLRPYPFLLSVAAQAAAVALLRFLLAVPLLVLLFVTIGEMTPVALALTPTRIAAYVAAVGLSLICTWLIRMVVGLFAFDLTQTWGPELVFIAFYTMAGGEAYPIDLLPEPWFTAATWTPAFYMVGFPVLVFLGRVSSGAYWMFMGRGAIVALVTCGVVWLMWRRGLRRFEAVGI